MKTAVVILNWNTRDYLCRFLPGLLKSCEGRDAQVIVADSGSTDGSLDLLKEEFPGVRTIALGGNYGFTGGYNRALAEIDAQYYVLINSDIEVTPDWLGPLEEWMDRHSGCAVCGPKLLSYYDKGMFEYAGAAGGYVDRFGYPYCRGRVPGKVEQDRGQYDGAPARVHWVSGACLMTRSRVWKELGGLDDRFFAHMEEIDYCWRARLRGYGVYAVPASTVYHIGGGTLPKESPRKLRLNFRNNLLLLDGNLPPTIGAGRARLRIAVRRCLDLGSALVYLLRGRGAYAKAVLQGHAEYRKLRRKTHRKADPKASGMHRDAMMDICILPLAALPGERVFKYLKRYEDSHCRRR